MASQLKTLSLIPLLSLLAAYAQAGSIAVYWGQNGNEGTLKSTCETGNYDYVILAFLDTTYGEGEIPVLNLGGHCNSFNGGCKNLTTDIHACQAKGIKVLVSLGGPSGDARVNTSRSLSYSKYIWNNYLGGTSSDRPLGPAVLDGLDYYIDISVRMANYLELTKYLSAYNKKGKKVLLTAAPQCTYPDAYLGPAISSGLFDYVWVQFYKNPSCQYSSGDISKLISSWNTWTSKVKATKIFLGLPASPDAASGGFISPDVLKSKVLPIVKKSAKYGGIMLWSRYSDEQDNYSYKVRKSV
ncbi:hypothetical protein LUZ60_000557 [Juncus effusus]|nr:hypothetical protein LUZ60_000557 [Juncus effusus]